jgi:hypothetical protein
MMLTSKVVKIKSGDWFCSQICDLVSRDAKHFSLVESVQFEAV